MFPNLAKKTALVKVKIGNVTGWPGAGTLVWAEIVTRQGEIRRLDAAALGFGYRHSTVPPDAVVVRARFRGAPGAKAAKPPRIPVGKRVDVPASEHGIDPSLVDERARKVVETLQDAGYEAYIVGGAVRDLILGMRPKDFDVATNATPEQVKALFRRAFIIGRRFRIVHVVYGRGREHEVIEVSTFRA